MASSGATSASGATPPVSVHTSSSGVRVGIVGCGHGELDAMYSAVRALRERDGVSLDLLLCCGDFQSVRSWSDLKCMACPEKYRRLNTFYKYYNGEAVAPVLTIFIGGNHEASNYLTELFHGGWVAPNIYYMGFAGVVNFGGLRLGGLSGIWNERHARMGHYEHAPFDRDSERSVYHVRELDMWRLMQLRDESSEAGAASVAADSSTAAATAASSVAPAGPPMDLFLSHDWPRHIARHGDTAGLLRRKSFLASEIADGSLGSPPAEQLLHTLKPRYWFSAHMHVKFAAVVRHGPQQQQQGQSQAAPTSGSATAPSVTHFLALDKCLPHRDYMQLLEFPHATGPKVLCYDAAWLAVVRSTAPFISLRRQGPNLPPVPAPQRQHASQPRMDFRPTQEEIDWIHERFAALRAASPSSGAADASLPALAVPHNFVRTAPGWVPSMGGAREAANPAPFAIDPQTAALLHALQLPDIFTQAWGRHGQHAQQHQQQQYQQQSQYQHQQQTFQQDPSLKRQRTNPSSSASGPAGMSASTAHNPDEISLDDDEEAGGCCGSIPATAAAAHNPDEIAIDDEEPPATTAATTSVAAAVPNSEEINIDDL